MVLCAAVGRVVDAVLTWFHSIGAAAFVIEGRAERLFYNLIIGSQCPRLPHCCRCPLIASQLAYLMYLIGLAGLADGAIFLVCSRHA